MEGQPFKKYLHNNHGSQKVVFWLLVYCELIFSTIDMACSLLAGPRTANAVVAKITPTIRNNSNHGMPQGVPNVRVIRLEYRNQ